MIRNFLGLFLLFFCVFQLKAQNNESIHFPASMASGTLPIVYVNTKDCVPIVDKVNPIPAGLYIISNDTSISESLGSVDSPIDLTIRGRGNTTWNLEKKPYKLKFDKKTSLFGLPKSKHYALMAYCSHGADWAYNFVGFELARRLDMGWQPSFVPVELVLNGEYEGVYWLSETIKIDENRLDIFEQEDLETDPDKIPYGWLLEIDNYIDDYQYRFEEKEGREILFTFKTPEILSKQQEEWLFPELRRINSLIYDTVYDEPEWTQYVDLESAVKYFIVRELLHDYDAYCGSFYLHKDRNDSAKWKFGPIWDNVINSTEKKSYSIHYRPDYWYSSIHWMDQMMLYPCFTEKFKTVWNDFYESGKIDSVLNDLKLFSSNLNIAFKQNNLRWPDMEDWRQYNVDEAVDACSSALQNNSQWMNENQDIHSYMEFVSSIYNSDFDTSGLLKIKDDCLIIDIKEIKLSTVRIFDINGRELYRPGSYKCPISNLEKGTYIVCAQTHSGKRSSIKFIK